MSVNVQKLDYHLGRSSLKLPKKITKRDGSVVTFDLKQIEKAIVKCYDSLEVTPVTPATEIVESAARTIAWKHRRTDLSVEHVHDIVEVTLSSAGEYEAAKHYILYRAEHDKERGAAVPADIKEIFDADKEYFPTPIQQFQFYDKYSRFNWELMRRETWTETVDRVVDYLQTISDNKLSPGVYERIRDSILKQRAMPSMRALAMAGPAALRNSMAIFNCSAQPVDGIDSFVEAMMISLSGCGVGYSVERQFVEQLPRIKRQGNKEPSTHVVDDSSDGWALALRTGLEAWFDGRDMIFDYSLVRGAGVVLKVKGGRASGPDPLKFAINYCRDKMLSRQGSFLRTIDAHDMMCAIGGAAVSGGQRRTAMICLFDWDDMDMRTCKDGTKLDTNPVRYNANNSAVWPDELSQQDIIQQMLTMDMTQRGEPGIFSRSNAERTKPARRESGTWLTNPCGEVILSPRGLCNLTIAVGRYADTVEDLKDKVEVAAIIGTIQTMATNFPGMRPEWKENAERERLLGVDITGQQDCPAVQDGAVMSMLKNLVIKTNEDYADLLGINPSVATTCNKPAGNSSTLLDTSSGIHYRWAPYYLRRTRVSVSTPLYRVLKDAGVVMSPENGQDAESATTWVVPWPVASPPGVKTRNDVSAVEQCEYWLLCKTHWTEHNPSVTITYRPDELLDITKWVYDHRELIGGLTFFPRDDAAFSQPPYEEISEQEYLRHLEEFPEIDYSLLFTYEHSDMTTSSQELACVSGACDV